MRIGNYSNSTFEYEFSLVKISNTFSIDSSELKVKINM